MTVPSRAFPRAGAWAFLFSIAATAWGAWETGPGLALFFGAMFLATLYVPALTLAEEPPRQWLSPAMTLIGITLCWVISTAWIDVTPGELLRCGLVCGAFVFALSSAASALARLGLPSSLAAGIVSITALLWLSWPVWLSHALTQTRVNALVAPHPLFAINAVVQHLGAWDRAPMAYQRLTILNQDIPFHLPRTILPAVVVHATIAAIAFTIPLRNMSTFQPGTSLPAGDVLRDATPK